MPSPTPSCWHTHDSGCSAEQGAGYDPSYDREALLRLVVAATKKRERPAKALRSRLLNTNFVTDLVRAAQHRPRRPARTGEMLGVGFSSRPSRGAEQKDAPAAARVGAAPAAAPGNRVATKTAAPRRRRRLAVIGGTRHAGASTGSGGAAKAARLDGTAGIKLYPSTGGGGRHPTKLMQAVLAAARANCRAKARGCSPTAATAPLSALMRPGGAQAVATI